MASPRASRPETKSVDRRNNITSLVSKIPNRVRAARDNDEKRAEAASDPLEGQHLIGCMQPCHIVATGAPTRSCAARGSLFSPQPEIGCGVKVNNSLKMQRLDDIKISLYP